LSFLTAEAEKINNFLTASEFNPTTLPLIDKTAKEQIKHLQNLLHESKTEVVHLHKKAKRQAQNLKQVKFIYDNLLEQKHELEIKQKLADTNYAFVIEGWLKKSDFKKLKEKLDPPTEVLAVEPKKDEKPPVILSNPKVLTPFELITQIYGTPKPSEFDPSIPLSFFFALFFGLCLGDFGYGLALTLISLYFLKKYKLPAGGTKLFQLLMLGGATSMIVGLLTGAYFGFTPADLPLSSWLTSIQIIDPIKSPLTMLIFSLALGIVQILFGILLQMALHMRNKEYTQAILDDGIWFFFLSSLVFLIVASAMSLPVAGLAGKLSLAGAAGLVLTQGRHKKTIVQKFLSGLLSLYKLSGYMGDTLSYSRLLALGMSSTIIGSVINILAGMVKGSAPVIGIILMVVLLIFGHLFNLVISTLSAFVHSTRLQMVEFFSKFYEGGGREFKPYKRVAEYTTII
ncbi:MAG: V-type ATPase 116kDa subunit family protein, partial [bacterium]